MWHDAWPPLPPGGHRPPDAPPFTSPGDQLLAVGLGAAAGAGALVWATGQAAGLAFGHTWLELSPGDVAHVLWTCRSTGATPPWPGPPTCGAAARPGRHVRHLHRPSRWPVRRDRGGVAAPAGASGRSPPRPRTAGQACRRGLGQRSGAAAAHRRRSRAWPGDPGPPPVSWAGCWRPRTATRYWSSAPPAATRPRPWSSPPSSNGPAPGRH